MAAAQEVVNGLQVLEVIAPAVSVGLRPHLLSLLPDLLKGLLCPFTAIRHMCARCITTMARVDLHHTMQVCGRGKGEGHDKGVGWGNWDDAGTGHLFLQHMGCFEWEWSAGRDTFKVWGVPPDNGVPGQWKVGGGVRWGRLAILLNIFVHNI